LSGLGEEREGEREEEQKREREAWHEGIVEVGRRVLGGVRSVVREVR
jgi:hypothetical protein